ncbi:MAG: PDZ domain-containing protein [Nitrospirae bacterium]|nr:MAG: PDZ domain-containing protein [Nitrospirota bacterium]
MEQTRTYLDRRLRGVRLQDYLRLICRGLVPCLLLLGMSLQEVLVWASAQNGEMTEEKALQLAEEFGIDVGEVDEEIKEYLGLPRAEGVVVFAVIGGTPAERAGIKVKAIIKEVDGKEIKTLIDLGKALEKAMPTENFSVATFEPADPNNQGVTGGLNFHFVRVEKD